MSLKVVFLTILVLALFAGLYSTNFADEAKAPQYVGVSKCQICHNNDKIAGTQYAVWKDTAHANAYDVLATEDAKAAAEEAGIEGDPQEADSCLKCHVTAWEEDEELRASTWKKEDGITCETCHGPGQNYMAMGVMKDLDAAKAAGLIIPDEKTCVKCHNDESPFFPGEFKFEEMKKKIKHWEDE